MRRPLIAGNWKMNTLRAEAAALAQGVAAGGGKAPQADIVVCPPSCYLDAVRAALAAAPGGKTVALGAQNMYYEAGGAFTGELSAAMLLDLGCRFVILGHSERRAILKESDEDVNRKTLAALAAGLTPIVCVGESRAERESGRTASVVRGQAEGSLAGLTPDLMSQVVLAYEPVWAIGTGLVATPAQAEEVHSDLRKLVASRYNAQLAQGVRILYGGSVKASNAAELLSQPNVDGALVGGASLRADEFIGIAVAAPASK